MELACFEFYTEYMINCPPSNNNERYIKVDINMKKEDKERLIKSYVEKINYLKKYEIDNSGNELKIIYAKKTKKILLDEIKTMPYFIKNEINKHI
jgi:hypothetical protein